MGEVEVAVGMAIGELDHEAYPRHMATDDRVALPIGMAAVIAVATLKVTEVIVPVVSEEERSVGMVGDLRRMQVGRQGHVARRIMGTVRAEGNNTTRRKVCSTSQCEPDESCGRCVFVAQQPLYAKHSVSQIVHLCVVTRLCVVLCAVRVLYYLLPPITHWGADRYVTS